MHSRLLPFLVALSVGTCLGLPRAVGAGEEEPRLVFACASDNDLYRVLAQCGMKCPRHDDPMAAVHAAPDGSGVLLLADQYPHQTQSIDAAVFELAAHFLQQKRLGVFLPSQVEFAVSDDGKSFRTVATLAHDVPRSEAGPLMRTIAADNLDLTARYVRVLAHKTGAVGRDWLFVDEILVNPPKDARP